MSDANQVHEYGFLASPEAIPVSGLVLPSEIQHNFSLYGKKRYSPPRPDADTFDSQEEFVNSLVSIPIAEVEEYNRKCPHCWKRYGESDQGADNAENPVKFRCGHVFGEKCMKDVFRLPTAVKVDLCPISFESGSRGADLGARLDQFLALKENVGDKSENTSASSAADKPPRSFLSRRGKASVVDTSEAHLAELIRFVHRPNRNANGSAPSGVFGSDWYHVMHNIVLSNHKVVKIHFLENGAILDTSGTPKVSHHPALFLSSGYGHPLPVVEVSGLAAPTHPAHHTYAYMSSEDQEVQVMLFQEVRDAYHGHETDVYAMIFGTHSAWDSVSSSPSIATSPLAPPTPGKEANPITHVGQVLKTVPLVPSLASSKQVKSIQDMYNVCVEYVKKYAPDHVFVPFDTLKEKAKNNVKAKQLAHDKKVKDALKRQDEERVEEEAAWEIKAKVIVSALLSVLEQYRMTSLARLLSPSPPPLKKLKSNPFMPHMHPGQNHAPIFAAISVHKKDMGVTHYEIPQPHESLAYSSPSFTDSETEADTDTEASDGENKLSGRMFVLVRNPCTASCCVSPVKGSPFPDGGTSLRDLNLGEPPRSIGWKDVKSAPDACPLCRKVLFKKAGPKRKQRFGD